MGAGRVRVFLAAAALAGLTVAAAAEGASWRACVNEANAALREQRFDDADRLYDLAKSAAASLPTTERSDAFRYVAYNEGILQAVREATRAEASGTFATVGPSVDDLLAAHAQYNIGCLALDDAIGAHEQGRALVEAARQGAGGQVAGGPGSPGSPILLPGAGGVGGGGGEQDAGDILGAAIGKYAEAQRATRQALAHGAGADARHNFERALLGQKDAERLLREWEELQKQQEQEQSSQSEQQDPSPQEKDEQEQSQDQQQQQQQEGASQQEQPGDQQKPEEAQSEESQQPAEQPEESESEGQQQPREEGETQQDRQPNPDAQGEEMDELSEDEGAERPDTERGISKEERTLEEAEQKEQAEPTDAEKQGDPKEQVPVAVDSAEEGMSDNDARAILRLIDDRRESEFRRMFLRYSRRGHKNNMEKAW